jgi:predicted nucleic acid-binding protein
VTTSALVLDASVVVEYLVELRFTTQATTLFRRLQTQAELELWVPDLVFVEVTSALRRLVRGRVISRSEGERCVNTLQRLPLSVAKSQSLIPGAYEASDAMTLYDAIYAVLAARLSCELVTADAKLARVVRSRRQRVLLLSEVS